MISVGPTDSGETQHTEPTIDSASSLQIVLVSLRTLLASEIINQMQKIISIQQSSVIYKNIFLKKKILYEQKFEVFQIKNITYHLSDSALIWLPQLEIAFLS